MGLQDGVAHVELGFRVPDGFEDALAAVEGSAVDHARNGARVIVLSDRTASDVPVVDAEHAAIPVLLAIARVNRRLVEEGLRTRVGLVTDVAGAWHEHHLACQLGFGADAVHPWMALEWAERLGQSLDKADPAGERFRKVLHHGVMKVMSKHDDPSAVLGKRGFITMTRVAGHVDADGSVALADGLRHVTSPIPLQVFQHALGTPGTSGRAASERWVGGARA